MGDQSLPGQGVFERDAGCVQEQARGSAQYCVWCIEITPENGMSHFTHVNTELMGASRHRCQC